MPQLLIDVGNTKSKMALSEGGRLTSDVLLSDHEKTAAEAIAMARKGGAKACLISSVADGAIVLVTTLKEAGLDARLLTVDMKLPFALDYTTPRTLGTDRVAGVAGVVAQFGMCDALVIDAGTAITYDFLTSDGVFRGGAISPGIGMRFRSLHAFTARLPLCAPYDAPDGLVGKDTRSAIAAGVMNGVRAEADYFIDQFRQKHPQGIVVLTGGNYENFDLTSKIGIFARPNIVLDGLANIANLNF